ncbi:MAG: hypothetical protein AAGE89_06990 [Pseudomonadota bacterium]
MLRHLLSVFMPRANEDSNARSGRQTNGFDVEISKQSFDDETQIGIIVVGSGDPPNHTACRIIASNSGTLELYAGFAISGYYVATPEDLPSQEEANAAMEAVLQEEFGDAADLLDAFKGAWSKAKSYLQNRWAENEVAGLTPERLIIVHNTYAAKTGIATGQTLMGKDSFLVVENLGDTYKRILNDYHSGKINYDVSPPTQDLVNRLRGLSGHQKLDLLKGVKSKDYEAARSVFEEQRKRDTVRRKVIFPLRTDDAIAHQNDQGIDIFFSNGDWGYVWIKSPGETGAPFWGRLILTKSKSSIDFEIDNHGSSFKRVANETRFLTPEKLNEAVRRVIETILIIDQPLAPELLTDNEDHFDVYHPILNGLTIPPRHRQLVGAILGAPYDSALKEAQKLADRAKKKAEKADALSDLQKILADGAFFGTVDCKRPSDHDNRTKLAYVATVSGQGAKRKRQITPLRGFEVPRPFTAKQIARLPLLENPDDLSLAQDRYLNGHNRDVMEAAFRASFSLAASATNPLLEATPEIDVIATDLTGFDLRISKITDAPGINLFAVALAQSKIEGKYPNHLSTGCGFIALRIGDEQHYHVRPAVNSEGISLPNTHRSEIEAYIMNHTGHDPKYTEALLNGFKVAWTAQVEKDST